MAEQNTGNNNPENSNNNAGNPENNTNNEKTFTQEDVNRMLANEKRQGRQAVLKALGLDPDDKDAEKKAKALLDTQKSDAEKAAEALKVAQDAAKAAEARTQQAERKYSVIEAGCKADFIDEVLTLASGKVNETVTFDAALKAVKEKCPSFFIEGDGGTGNGQGHKRQESGEKAGSFGARLAQKQLNSNVKENPYFKN